MPKLMLTNAKEGQVGHMFYCPGCKHHHVYDVPRWSFNGNMDKPTFTPSLLVYIPTRNGNKTLCHLFVTDGKIQFLGDCEHELRGKTVDMEEVEQ